MKQITLSVLIVLALISVNPIISTAYADSKIKIFKVTKVSPSSSLKLRAWPSTKSRIKTKLPYNAKDLTETGKKRIIGKTKWLEVKWQKQRGWVKARYLKKTGVLLKTSSIASRNSRSLTKIPQQTTKTVVEPIEALNEKPQEYGGDRYDQPAQLAATGVKTAYATNEESNTSKQILLCDGINPRYWNIKMNVADKNMQIKFSKSKTFNVPINYHAWATPNKLRMNIGGNQGRNIVDVNLEKTDACYNGITKSRFTYEVNATINREFYSGCCEVVTR